MLKKAGSRKTGNCKDIEEPRLGACSYWFLDLSIITCLLQPACSLTESPFAGFLLKLLTCGCDLFIFYILVLTHSLSSWQPYAALSLFAFFFPHQQNYVLIFIQNMPFELQSCTGYWMRAWGSILGTTYWALASCEHTVSHWPHHTSLD